MTTIKRGDIVTINASATKATGCVPAGAPHIHAGTCSDIIATRPCAVPDLHAGRTGRVNCVDADTGAVVVDFDDDDQDEYDPSDVTVARMTTMPCEPWRPAHPSIGPPPVFHRATTPYWQAACGCEAAANEWRYCVRHATAPEMAALLREMYDAAQSVPILKEPGWDIGDITNALPMMKALEKSRALLARIDGR